MIEWLKRVIRAPRTPAVIAPPMAARFTDEEYSGAALKALRGRLRLLNDFAATLHGNERTLIAEREAIAQLRVWAGSVEDKNYAAALHDWLDYAERGANEYERELRTGEGKADMERYRAKQSEQQSRLSDVARQLPKP